MKTWRFRRFGSSTAVLAVVAVLLASLAITAPSASAQEDRYETCGAYRSIIGTGGQFAADAAARLQALAAPNPPGIDNALETIINAEADVAPIGSRPTNDARQLAYETLDGYYGAVCADIDICPLIRQAVATNDASSAAAARLALDLTRPGPPGILAALEFIAGGITESPFHDTIAEAQAQIASYYPCDATPTPAPPVTDVAATCGDLAVLSIPEGPRAIEAAESLRARGAPNPPGIEAALDTVVAAADFSSTSPPLSEIDAALATLNSYFGGVCASLDRCLFVAQIGGSDAAAAAQAAHLLRRIETPAPPGIDAALALIAGDIDESPFHSSVTEARDQVLSYYPCGDSGAGGGAGGDDGGLAFTGVSTAPLAALGFALVATGAGLLRSRRRIVAGE